MRCLRNAEVIFARFFCILQKFENAFSRDFSRFIDSFAVVSSGSRILIFLLLMTSHVVFCLEPDERGGTNYRQLWNEAVAAGDMETAVRLSKMFVPSSRAVPDQLDQARRLLFSHSEISPSFLDASFNEYDFVLWRRKLFFSILSHQLVPETASDDEVVSILFEAVRTRLAKGDLKQRDHGVNLWPEIIWQERAGYCDRQAWCLSELLLQHGFRTILIMLFDKDGVSPHTFLEAEKGSKFFLLDPFCDKMISGKSFRDMETDETLSQKFWPENGGLQKAIRFAKYVFPASPQEYRRGNILLFEELRHKRKEEKEYLCMNDPFTALGAYIGKHRLDPERCSFWAYPFSLLADDIRHHKSPSIIFPKP